MTKLHCQMILEYQLNNVVTVYPQNLNVTTQAVHFQKKEGVLFVVSVDMKITRMLKD